MSQYFVVYGSLFHESSQLRPCLFLVYAKGLTYSLGSGINPFKAPNKNCSRRHFNVILLSVEENKA